MQTYALDNEATMKLLMTMDASEKTTAAVLTPDHLVFWRLLSGNTQNTRSISHFVGVPAISALSIGQKSYVD